MLYVAKPSEVEAVQFKMIEEVVCKFGVHKEYNAGEICRFMGLAALSTHFDKIGPYLTIYNNKGALRVNVGDYVVCFNGQFYPISEAEFNDRYVPMIETVAA